jgi:hypothetical protein
MKKILIYGILIGGLIFAVSRPTQSGKDQTQAWADYYKRCRENNLALEAQRKEYYERERKENLGPCPNTPLEWKYAELAYKCRVIIPKASELAPYVGRPELPHAPEYVPPVRSAYMAGGESSGDSPFLGGSRPNLSGVYSTIPATGPNSGKVQFSYVQGPF